MIVNTEWGAFGDQSELDFILTKWDREVDRLSINPGKQIFEKMISGMYMGEVVRQVLIDLVHEGLMFVGQNTENLFQHGRFYTKYVSEVESDPVGDFTRCRLALEDLGMQNVTEEDCSALRYLYHIYFSTYVETQKKKIWDFGKKNLKSYNLLGMFVNVYQEELVLWLVLELLHF